MQLHVCINLRGHMRALSIRPQAAQPGSLGPRFFPFESPTPRPSVRPAADPTHHHHHYHRSRLLRCFYSLRGGRERGLERGCHGGEKVANSARGMWCERKEAVTSPTNKISNLPLWHLVATRGCRTVYTHVPLYWAPWFSISGKSDARYRIGEL